jgi:hypothetical protein
MLFNIDGQPRDLTPIKDFRVAHDLPPEFGVGLFEPKDYAGLGRIDRAGAELNSVRDALLDALPAHMNARGWLTFLPDYARLFESKLYDINAQVGLKDVEIEFAVAGLSDVLHQFAYALVRLKSKPTTSPFHAMGEGDNLFRQVYADWLNNSLKVFSGVYPYDHQGKKWDVQIIAHAYGRAGLIVRTPSETYYVYDPALGCPAEGFMAALLTEIAARMAAATE